MLCWQRGAVLAFTRAFSRRPAPRPLISPWVRPASFFLRGRADERLAFTKFLDSDIERAPRRRDRLPENAVCWRMGAVTFSWAQGALTWAALVPRARSRQSCSTSTAPAYVLWSPGGAAFRSRFGNSQPHRKLDGRPKTRRSGLTLSIRMLGEIRRGENVNGVSMADARFYCGTLTRTRASAWTSPCGLKRSAVYLPLRSP